MTMKNVNFTVTKTAINLFMVLIRNASRFKTTGYDKGASLDPVLTPAFLKALNKPYV